MTASKQTNFRVFSPRRNREGPINELVNRLRFHSTGGVGLIMIPRRIYSAGAAARSLLRAAVLRTVFSPCVDEPHASCQKHINLELSPATTVAVATGAGQYRDQGKAVPEVAAGRGGGFVGARRGVERLQAPPPHARIRGADLRWRPPPSDAIRTGGVRFLPERPESSSYRHGDYTSHMRGGRGGGCEGSPPSAHAATPVLRGPSRQRRGGGGAASGFLGQRGSTR